jgi:hypothetical protein
MVYQVCHMGRMFFSCLYSWSRAIVLVQVQGGKERNGKLMTSDIRSFFFSETGMTSDILLFHVWPICKIA